MSDCVFCRIVAGQIPATRVYEDELTLAFMDIGQVNPGHVLVALKGLFPEAPVFTTIYDRAGMPAVMRDWEIRTSALDRLPGIYRRHQAALPLYPFAWEQFDFSGFDVVLGPQATAGIVDYEVPGMAEAMRAAGRAITPLADLSRGVVGVRAGTLIVNLPGSPRGALESLAALEPLLDHALETLAGPFDHSAGAEGAP